MLNLTIKKMISSNSRKIYVNLIITTRYIIYHYKQNKHGKLKNCVNIALLKIRKYNWDQNGRYEND